MEFKTQEYYQTQELKFAVICLTSLEILYNYSSSLIENRREHLNFSKHEALKKLGDNYNKKDFNRIFKNQVNKLNNDSISTESFYKKMMPRYNFDAKLDEDLHTEFISVFEKFFDEKIKINSNSIEIN